MVSFIPKNSFVLDVGCADGKLGEHLKKNLNCTVFGIEKNEFSANIAKEKIDKVFCIDLEEKKPPIADGTFDVIIFSDVLEHLKEPEKTIAAYRVLLKPTGKIVVSVPNIANFLIRIKLLFGMFDYQDKGILDSTHLRFFTEKTIKKTIIDCGFVIVKIKATQNILESKPPRKFLQATRLQGAYDKAHYMLANKWKSLFAKQFVILAEKIN